MRELSLETKSRPDRRRPLSVGSIIRGSDSTGICHVAVNG